MKGLISRIDQSVCFWHLLVFLTGILQSDVCSSQRVVQMQDGPLYRVKGYSISLSCNVSGFTGPSVQDFDFSVKRVKNPDIDVNMISTHDSSFSYAVFSDRVQKKEIEIKRLSGSSVLLKISTLQAGDGGVYTCHTPNTDGEYNGIYGAETAVIVIEDTLTVSYSGSISLSVSEGDSLQLECHVSTQTFQHTHLSVSWFLQEDASARPIITLDRDLTVRPGAGFEERYYSGLISMDKVDDTIFRLKMIQVQQSERGKFYCKAVEWIQDPDRAWTQIAYKSSTPCHVEIKRLEVSPDVGSFMTYMETSQEPVQEGQTLDIRCIVKTQNLPGLFFSVVWMKDQKKVAEIGPSGVLTVSDDYKKRETEAELRAVKISHTDYLLNIRSARADDQGQYQCKVMQENMNADGTFTKIQTLLSKQKTISITAKESDLVVLMMMENDAVTEGELLRVICSVSGFKGPLSVSWQHKKDSGDSFSDVISLTHDGVMQEVGMRYQGREIQTFRSSDGNVSLDIREAMTSDAGEYKCIVSEWIIQNNGRLDKANLQSQQKNISVQSIELKVTLKSRATNVPVNSSTDLICTVRGPKVSLAVHWTFLPSNSSTHTNILSVHHTGEITWTSEQRNYQLSIQIQTSATIFALRIVRSSKRQEGQYMCKVDAYQKNIQKASKNSNLLAVTVQKPVSRLILSRPKSRLESTVNTDVKIECSITRTSTDSSQFNITWLLGSQTLMVMDRHAVVRVGPAAGLEMDQRIHMNKKDKQTFVLSIHQVRTSDSGLYECEVQEFLQDPLGDWYPLQTASVSTQLVIKEKGDVFKMNKTNSHLKVTEGEQLTLSCSVDGVGRDAAVLYSLTWFLNQNQSSDVPLLTYTYDGRLMYSSSDSKMKRRYQFSSSDIGVFYLIISRSISEDSGRYYCQVHQYQLDCKGQWSSIASDKSGFTDVSVHPLDNKLHVLKENRSLHITNLQAVFSMDCVINSRSSDESVFEVTWFRRQRDERPIIIYNASRDGTLHSAVSDKDLMFGHPKANHYKLTVPNINPTDAGLYHCQVIEWIRTTVNNWRRIAEDKSEELSVYVESNDTHKENSFAMDKTDKHLDIKEGDAFELTCSLNLMKEDPTLHYSLKWVFGSQKSSSWIYLLTYSHDGRLQYQQQKDRLRFSRPSPSTFNLMVFNSETADDGSYQCVVDQYQLDCEGKWIQTTSAQSGSTIVKVHTIESNLHVLKRNHTLNITKLQTEFIINCEIKSRSSNKSAFEVTWFKGQKQEQPTIIFIAKRDGTLDSPTSRSLVFGRPGHTLYTLTIANIRPTDMGQYYCQVEEWLQTSANIWKKVASDSSGQLSVHVHIEGESEKQRNPVGTAVGIFIPLICFLALVIIILLRREHKRNSDLKKKKESLWAELNPLNPVAAETITGQESS